MEPNPLEGMLGEELPVEAPAEEGSPELEMAFADFDDPEMPLEVRAEALRLIVELVS